ncbi:MAG: PEP-utilizing enzyme [Oscillospiraceae bacterium]
MEQPFSSKADTLLYVSQHATSWHVLPQCTFSAQQLLDAPEQVELAVAAALPGTSLFIVRSSAPDEDGAGASRAGAYLSVANVAQKGLLAACRQVVASYGGQPGGQVLVQPMLTQIKMAGVLFTADPNTGGHYHVVNYSESGRTDTVTSGGTGAQEVCYIFRGRPAQHAAFRRLQQGGEELAALFGQPALDIEFAFTQDDAMVLLQVRPLVLTQPLADFETQKKELGNIHRFIEKEMAPQPYVKGSRTIYGNMPDWNPAEMIGTRPRPLALSLYRRLITNGTWAYQRDNYGYRNLRSFPLMHDFSGIPYIDTRVSFNSFIPKDINDALCGKLADYYLDQLQQQPASHDKVEFDIIFSCYTFDLPERVRVLGQHGFSSGEQRQLTNALKRLTNNIINVTDGLWITDARKVDILEERQRFLFGQQMDTVAKLYWVLEDCARYGTLPFAGLARSGFIAVLLLRSLVSIGILSQADYARYFSSLSTVGSQMARDRETLSKAAFIEKYGHLRPGTYEVTSPCYAHRPELYYGTEKGRAAGPAHSAFSLSLAQYEQIQQEMQRHGLQGDALGLFKFTKAGIEGREYAKFVFTKSLSYALELFAAFGEEHGFSREDMSYVDCGVVDTLYSSPREVRPLLAHSIAEGRRRHAQTTGLTMPPVILHADDIYAFTLPTGMPNFITLKSVCAEVVTSLEDRAQLNGRIVVVPAADPGFDWIFTCGIAGFVTTYGGANSHMAIRAGELGIPAVIGAGEKLTAQWRTARILSIDCANKRVEVVGQ